MTAHGTAHALSKTLRDIRKCRNSRQRRGVRALLRRFRTL